MFYLLGVVVIEFISFFQNVLFSGDVREHGMGTQISARPQNQI